MGGFVRENSSDSYVLLGGGGHKPISDFAGASHSHDYLPLSGGTISGNLTVTGDSIFKQSAYIFNGYDLILRATSGSDDSGDIIFQNGSGTETGRIFRGNYYGDAFLIRFSSSDSPKALIHTGNISNYVSGGGGNYLPLTGGTMTGSVFFNGNGIIADTPDYYPTANDLGNLNKSGTFIFGYRNTYAAGHPISFGCSININNDGNTCFQSGRFDGQKTAYNLIFQPAGGNIGIGTTSPSYKLDVNGTACINGALTIRGENGISGPVSIELNEFGALSGYGGFIDFHFNGSSSDFTSRIIEEQSGTLTCYAHLRAYSYTNWSDIRLKNKIKNVEIPLEIIARAPAFQFTWKNPKMGSGYQIGTSAQYWQTILPELTTIANDSDQTLSLQYDVAALVSAISIAKKTVEHEQKINYLESQITQLRNEILNLKNTDSN